MTNENMENPDPVIVDPTEPLWTVEDIADYLRLEPETVRSMTRDGKLPGFKVGRVWRYKKDSISQWLKNKEE